MFVYLLFNSFLCFVVYLKSHKLELTNILHILCVIFQPRVSCLIRCFIVVYCTGLHVFNSLVAIKIQEEKNNSMTKVKMYKKWVSTIVSWRQNILFYWNWNSRDRAHYTFIYTILASEHETLLILTNYNIFDHCASCFCENNRLVMNSFFGRVYTDTFVLYFWSIPLWIH